MLVWISSQKLLLILGGFVLVFVAVNVSRFSFSVAPSLERYLSPPIGLFAGVLGGVTNVPGLPLVLYFYALGMDKTEFIQPDGAGLPDAPGDLADRPRRRVG